MAANGRRRVVVTGIGLVTPLGNDVRTTWDALIAGQSGAGPITHFEATEDYDCRFAGGVKGFQPDQYMDREEVRRMDRFAQLAIAAAQQAMERAGLDGADAKFDRDRTGVLIGSGIGGISTFEDQARVMVEKGPKRISPFFIPMFIPDIAAGHVSMRWGLRGPNYCTVSACASSAHAIGDAVRLVQTGEADIMVA